MYLVSEAEMKVAIPVIFEQTGFVAEGAAAAVFAQCLKMSNEWSDLRVATLFSGGNLGAEMLWELVSKGD